MRPALLLILMLASPLAARQKPPKVYSIPLPPQADFSSLGWLIGNWTGKTSEKSPPGTIHLSVSYTLGRRFMLLKEDVSLAATDSAPAMNESWLGILRALPSGQGYSLRMFSSTGFITRYRVSVTQAMVRLTPEGGELPPPGWLFRRTLERTGVDQISESVEVAPPDGSFFTYYTANLTQQKPSAPAHAAPQASPSSPPGEKSPPGKDELE